MNYQNLPVGSYQLGHLEKEAKNFHSQPGWVWWHKPSYGSTWKAEEGLQVQDQRGHIASSEPVCDT